jgi:hypothetical protein
MLAEVLGMSTRNWRTDRKGETGGGMSHETPKTRRKEKAQKKKMDRNG